MTDLQTVVTNVAVAFADVTYRAHHFYTSMHPSMESEAIFYEETVPISGGTTYVHGSVAYESPPNWLDTPPDFSDYASNSTSEFRRRVTQATFPDGWPGVAVALGEILVNGQGQTVGGWFAGFYDPIGGGGYPLAQGQFYGPIRSFASLKSIDDARVYHYQYQSNDFSPAAVDNEIIGHRPYFGSPYVYSPAAIYGPGSTVYSSGTEISIGGDIIPGGGQGTFSIDTHLYPEGTVLKLRAVGEGSRRSNWFTLWHLPLALFEMTYEDGVLSLDASESYGFESPIVDWQWSISGLFSHTMSGKVQSLDWQALVEAQEEVTVPDGAEFYVSLVVTNARGEQAQCLGKFVYRETAQSVGMLHNRAGEMFTAIAQGGAVNVYRFSDGTASRTLISSIPNAKSPTLWWRGAGQRSFEMRLMVQEGDNWRVRSSHDGGKGFVMPITVWTAPFTGASGNTLRNGDEISVARDGLNVYFRRSKGDDWSAPPVPVGALDSGSNKALQVRQRVESNSHTIEITNAFDKTWRSEAEGVAGSWVLV